MSEIGSSPQDDSFERCLNGARTAKNEGNIALQQGNLKSASFNYKKACLFLTEYIPHSEEFAGDSFMNKLVSKRRATTQKQLSTEQTAEIIELYAAVQNNLALVHLRLGRYMEGVRCATTVLSLPGYSSNTKALLRRSNCYLKLVMLKEAEDDIDAVESYANVEGIPVDPAAKTLRESIVVAKKDMEKKQREMYQRMFTK